VYSSAVDSADSDRATYTRRLPFIDAQRVTR